MPHATLGLYARTCQFHGNRIDEDGLLVFCGRPSREGSSYCGEHHRRIYHRAPRFFTLPVEKAREEPADVMLERELEVETA